MCCNGDCSTELYLAPFVIFQFDFLSPHFFFFFLNNSTPTVRMYCTVLYCTLLNVRILIFRHINSIPTARYERIYVRMYLAPFVTFQYNSYGMYVRIVYHTVRKQENFWYLKHSRIILLISNFILQNCTSLISNPSYCTVPYQWMSECRAWCR